MSAEALAKLVTKKDDRVVYEYDLPEELTALDDPFIKKTVGLVKLRMSEEISSSDRAQQNQTKLAYNWARHSLVEVDGRRINKGDGEDETILENTDPMIRELILSAYADISVTDKKVENRFLASRRIKVR